MNSLLTSRPFATASSVARVPSFDILLTPDGTIAATSPAWIVAFAQRIQELLTLPDGWDGEHSKALSVTCVMEALEFLFAALSHDTLAPHVVPTSEGGLQLEWHTRGIDLEVTFLPNSRASFLFSSEQAPDFEGSLNDHAAFVSSTLKTLRSSNVPSERR